MGGRGPSVGQGQVVGCREHDNEIFIIYQYMDK